MVQLALPGASLERLLETEAERGSLHFSCGIFAFFSC